MSVLYSCSEELNVWLSSFKAIEHILEGSVWRSAVRVWDLLAASLVLPSPEFAPHLLGGCRFSSIFWFHPTFCPPTFQKALPLSSWQLCQLQKSCLSRSTLGTELSETLHEEQQCWLWAELNSLSQGQRECCCVLGWSGLALGLRNVSQMPIFVIA